MADRQVNDQLYQGYGEHSLSHEDHDRASLGLRYVYTVLSRRAGGVSIGINLNPNNACNWRCIYCQVPGLVRGGPPPLDLALLREELRRILGELREGVFFRRHGVDPLPIRDVAFSGNGEPTAAPEFSEAVGVVGEELAAFGLAGNIALTVISNGSLIHRPGVRQGLSQIAALGGELWFKVDRVDAPGLALVNGTALPTARMARNLDSACGLCPTWVQSCVFTLDGVPPAEEHCQAYIDFVAGHPIRGVLLYSLARPSRQTEAPRLGRLDEVWLEQLAMRLRQRGLEVRAYA